VHEDEPGSTCDDEWTQHIDNRAQCLVGCSDTNEVPVGDIELGVEGENDEVFLEWIVDVVLGNGAAPESHSVVVIAAAHRWRLVESDSLDF